MHKRITVTLDGSDNINIYLDNKRIYSTNGKILGRSAGYDALTLNQALKFKGNSSYNWYSKQRELFILWYRNHFNNCRKNNKGSI